MGFSLGKLLNPITGSEDAAKAARQGTQQAMAAEKEMFEKNLGFQKEMWNWQKAQAQPFRKAGLSALGTFQDKLKQGFTFDPTGDSVYQARVSELDKQLASSQAARGMKFSGSTLKSLRDITAGELGASYGRQYGAWQDTLANLGNIVNVGQGSTMNLSNIGSNFSANVGQGYQNLGSSLAQGHQNLGAIGAQRAGAGFQDTLAVLQTVGGIAAGAGAMGYKPF